ncbi:MAG: acyl-CoA dehydrogenase family protein [Erythrobacter sp.]|uniref:acyl-CoA dehydrogenase family protein n=1 Tax=Erythrobacter sp. TaxID=1042 RepID=UPI00261125F0|nr:acyl-CoA dehydrogenase family protein [Erythrobacter sp.]MDJ0979704.1 acyl-CoA dehydrogenase family protein [Erythrobacter sp.]
MNLELSPEDLAFRDELREFFAGAVRPEYRTAIRAGLRPTPQQLTEWQATLAERGWGAPTWPKEYGGTGWTPTQLYIFETEAARADAPIQFHQGLELIGPIIFTFGTDDQKERYLPRIISGEDWWCQGYSEPGAGSDLAALSTRAVRDGDHYVINGQKMWTSYAHVASHMFCLVRTSKEERRQQGISLILVDMNTPGIKIRPVETLDEKHHTNEVFLDDVRVPVSNLLGEEGKGWGYGKVLLDRERAVGASTALRLRSQVDAIYSAARRIPFGGATLADTPAVATQLAQLEIEALTIETMVMRLMADAAAGVDSGPRASMLKLRWSETLQKVTELWTEVLGYDAAVFEDLSGEGVPEDMPLALQGALYARVTSIYGGSSEIQRNIIARRSLGL